jgi:hypothetical protein
MEEKIPNLLLKTIKCIYKNTKVSIKFNDDAISEPIQINKGVRQGCGLSPILFNAYINKILQEFKMVINELTNRKIINTILYADDQILIATSEDELQTMAYRLHLIARKYKMNISNIKTKSMAMCGNHIQRVKIVINDDPIEQISGFKYLGYLISDYKSNLEDNIQTDNKIHGVIRRHFGKQITKETKLRIHNITAKAALKFGCEVWVLKKRAEQRLEAAQMEFLRHLLGITKLDRETNQTVREKLAVQNAVLEIKQ